MSEIIDDDVAELEADLKAARQEITDLETQVENLKGDVDKLNEEIGNQEEEIRELERKLDIGNDLDDAVNEILDEVERPVGSLNALLPQSDRTARALIRLFDAVGRGL